MEVYVQKKKGCLNMLNSQNEVRAMGMEPPLRGKPEEELIRRFKEGRKESFDEMVVTYSPRLFRVAYGLLGNKQDAEEVVQDAFVRAYRALPFFRGDASFETWMHRITMNLARNKFHWNRRRGSGLNVSLYSGEENDPEQTVPQIDLPDTRMEPDRLLENTELEQNIVFIIRGLPGKLREAMVLRHMENLSYEQIAEYLNCKVGTVKSRLARGREILRQELARLDGMKNKQETDRRKP